MKLTRLERIILSNQYQILAALYPKSKEHFERAQEALENGYEAEYESLAQNVYKDEDTFSQEECLEAVNILIMFDALRISYEALKDKKDVDEGGIKFLGYDGNSRTEIKYLAYTRYICSGERFKDLGRGDDFNSHMPMLSNYRAMLKEYQKVERGESNHMTKEDIARIISARYPNKK